MTGLVSYASILCLFLSGVFAFAPTNTNAPAVGARRNSGLSPGGPQNQPGPSLAPRMSLDDWISLTGDDCAVKKRVIEEGDGPVADAGSEVEIDYAGTLADVEWSAEDVVECWLKEQQGLDSLAPAFLEKGIDGSKLMDDSYFTEDFVAGELGVANKIHCKKLVMAARRLSKGRTEHPSGTEFDSSVERGAFKFTLGAGKAIKCTDLAVSTMKLGERAEIIARADYAYGKDGLRRSNGDVVVPPFATLCFEIKLLSC